MREFENTYGEYRHKRLALADALEAANNAQQLGYVVEVWDRSTGKRLHD